MKKTIIKGAVIGVAFFAALVIISQMLNQGNNDLTVEMAPASYPLVYMETDGKPYNCLHGYQKAMDTSFERENITVLGVNRNTGIVVETYGLAIQEISYEVRSVDGERLIESTKITGYQETDNRIEAQIALKDLIEEETEYSLVILIKPKESDTIRYYTRAVWASEYYVSEKIDFVQYFHEATFNKESAKELSRYLESNAEGDNSTLHKVTIHSSLAQVSWGELPIVRSTEPLLSIKEISSQTGSFLLTYFVTVGEGRDKEYYQVTEYLRMRYTTERNYLLDYERTMNRVFSEEETSFENDKLMLGITDSDFEMAESGDGNVLVFENQGRLFSYNINDNKLSMLFGFFDSSHPDWRTLYEKHRIKILNVDEAGNIQFVVYGYMNRGRHEGDVGIQVYHYNGTLNTVEEVIYIPYSKSPDILMEDMEQLIYMNRSNMLFFMMENSVYAVNLMDKTVELLAEDINDGSVQVSDSQKMIVWQNSEDLYACEELMLMDLSTRRQIRINSSEGEYILPLGFMGEDIIYGLAHQEDIVRDSTGRLIFPMYALYIQNSEGVTLKSYQRQNIYISGCTIQDNQISLSLIQRQEDGSYLSIEGDQITNNEAEETRKNVVEIINAGIYQKQVQIVLKNSVDTRSLKVLTPKEVLFEGGRELLIEEEGSRKERFYVYGPSGMEGIYMNPANAVSLAYEHSGAVINDQGAYVYKRSSRASRNQIMAIKAAESSEEKGSIAVCLDAILGLEGIVGNSQFLLNMGNSAYDILKDNLVDYQVLNLTGCPLDAVLHYVNQDIPVLALLHDGNGVVIVGFNELETAFMDPQTGTIYKRRNNDAAEWLSENGNYYITYIK